MVTIDWSWALTAALEPVLSHEGIGVPQSPLSVHYSCHFCSSPVSSTDLSSHLTLIPKQALTLPAFHGPTEHWSSQQDGRAACGMRSVGDPSKDQKDVILISRKSDQLENQMYRKNKDGIACDMHVQSTLGTSGGETLSDTKKQHLKWTLKSKQMFSM